MLLCTTAAVSCGHAAPTLPRAGFTLQLGRAHPLIGRVYRAHGRERGLVSSERLRDALQASEWLVLGETHDNRDHHQLQAELLSVYFERHPDATVGFEMLDEDSREVLQRHAFTTPEQIAAQVQWSATGWPDFAIYRPVFAVALEQRAPIIAAHPSAARVRASMGGLPQTERAQLHLDIALPDAQIRAQHEEIKQAHCGHATPAMLTAMQRAQEFKDAFMAHALVQARSPSVLIAGRGHARNDRAVPLFLKRAGAAHTLSVALVEVDDAHTKPEDYGLEAFDFAIFTPRVSDEDPCEQFRKQLQHMQQPAADETD